MGCTASSAAKVAPIGSASMPAPKETDLARTLTTVSTGMSPQQLSPQPTRHPLHSGTSFDDMKMLPSTKGLSDGVVASPRVADNGARIRSERANLLSGSDAAAAAAAAALSTNESALESARRGSGNSRRGGDTNAPNGSDVPNNGRIASTSSSSTAAASPPPGEAPRIVEAKAATADTDGGEKDHVGSMRWPSEGRPVLETQRSHSYHGATQVSDGGREAPAGAGGGGGGGGRGGARGQRGQGSEGRRISGNSDSETRPAASTPPAPDDNDEGGGGGDGAAAATPATTSSTPASTVTSPRHAKLRRRITHSGVSGSKRRVQGMSHYSSSSNMLRQQRPGLTTSPTLGRHRTPPRLKPLSRHLSLKVMDGPSGKPLLRPLPLPAVEPGEDTMMTVQQIDEVRKRRGLSMDGRVRHPAYTIGSTLSPGGSRIQAATHAEGAAHHSRTTRKRHSSDDGSGSAFTGGNTGGSPTARRGRRVSSTISLDAPLEAVSGSPLYAADGAATRSRKRSVLGIAPPLNAEALAELAARRSHAASASASSASSAGSSSSSSSTSSGSDSDEDDVVIAAARLLGPTRASEVLGEAYMDSASESLRLDSAASNSISMARDEEGEAAERVFLHRQGSGAHGPSKLSQRVWTAAHSGSSTPSTHGHRDADDDGFDA